MSVSNLSTFISLIYILVVFFSSARVSGFPDKCPRFGRQANIYMNEDLLKNSEVYQDFSKATPCNKPGKRCSDQNLCNYQLRNFPVSNLIPCCVKLENGSSVCQCVVKMPNSNKCPRKSLALVSNQFFNMTGDSKFFGQTYPICSSLHNSWNIYRGRRCPVMASTPLPFLKLNATEKTFEKVGFQFFRADKFGHYCIIFYLEFLLTCKTDQTFISDDLNVCDGPCNSELPFAEIWMDTPASHLDDPDNAVFIPLKGTSDCEAISNTNNQCPAKPNLKCSPNDKPCCYSKTCLFPFNPNNNTCPCPPPQDKLILATNGILTCNALLIANSRFYLFKGDNPPGPMVFNWDLSFDSATNSGIFLFGRSTVILPLKLGGESLYWLAELKLPGITFKGCLAEIVGTLKTKLPFSLSDLADDA